MPRNCTEPIWASGAQSGRRRLPSHLCKSWRLLSVLAPSGCKANFRHLGDLTGHQCCGLLWPEDCAASSPAEVTARRLHHHAYHGALGALSPMTNLITEMTCGAISRHGGPKNTTSQYAEHHLCHLGFKCFLHAINRWDPLHHFCTPPCMKWSGA